MPLLQAPPLSNMWKTTVSQPSKQVDKLEDLVDMLFPSPTKRIPNKEAAIKAIRAYYKDVGAEAIEQYITWLWGERCETTDKEDSPDIDYDDPRNGRCACCEAWEQYDAYVKALEKS